ncbi:diacylglycerol kinase [Pseudomonadales bacterium]|jgi:diacylglycerol kinase (ATP)|nr:diacylglycerol kinase [Pseudomonadales bacterium]MDC0375362.1 diacylglycerol kinase [Pseudomonadales bacterium]
MSEKGLLGLLYRRGIQTLIHSMRGLRAAFQSEEAFRCEVLAFAFLGPAAFWVAKDALELILLLGAMLIVLMVELLNTGIELVVDRIGLERHELSGRAKDVGSAAVLMALLLFVLVWGAILYENVLS